MAEGIPFTFLSARANLKNCVFFLIKLTPFSFFLSSSLSVTKKERKSLSTSIAFHSKAKVLFFSFFSSFSPRFFDHYWNDLWKDVKRHSRTMLGITKAGIVESMKKYAISLRIEDNSFFPFLNSKSIFFFFLWKSFSLFIRAFQKMLIDEIIIIVVQWLSKMETTRVTIVGQVLELSLFF